MAKRTAQKQLTMDNYDEPEEEYDETADDGPQLATEEVLKNRPMAKAKRRSDLNASETDETKKTAFGGFSGFKGFATNTTQNPSFNAFKSFIQTESNDNTFKTLPSTQTNGGKPVVNPKTDSNVEDMTTEDSEDLYNTKLSELNKCFFQHITGYMNRSEFFDFTQVCKEYIDYHKKIESETKVETIGEKKNQISSSLSSQTTTLTSISDPNSSQSTQAVFGSQSTLSSQLSAPMSSQSSVGLFSSQLPKSEESSMFAKPNIQFGLTSKPFNTGFTTTETKVGSTTEDNANEESDEPPKVESVEHKEPDSVFSKKCKLFFKKGEEWCNKGIGYLYIKKDSSTTGAQLLIRADTKLGNILLHITLNDSLPISKAPQNKGVYLSCIPNPPLDPKASTQTSVTFLIRVKPEDIEQLFDTLVKYKTEK